MTQEFPQTIDSQVAEQVMGWTHNLIRNTVMADYWEWVPAGLACDAWQPSTCVGDAWQVVERMQQGGWYAVIRMLNETVYIQFHHGQFDLYSEATEASLGMAVCKAALAAVAQVYTIHERHVYDGDAEFEALADQAVKQLEQQRKSDA
jgi:hypothetical protein